LVYAGDLVEGIIDKQFIGHADGHPQESVSSLQSADAQTHHARIKKEIDKDFAKSKENEQ